ncbi:hypothetical protein [Halobaculum sp. D14]|uniref:hypothetical protein n=1 Tax=Halobaculum sp. D14 TaxID=3421642 RepID=UPI003EBC4A0E
MRIRRPGGGRGGWIPGAPDDSTDSSDSNDASDSTGGGGGDDAFSGGSDPALDAPGGAGADAGTPTAPSSDDSGGGGSAPSAGGGPGGSIPGAPGDDDSSGSSGSSGGTDAVDTGSESSTGGGSDPALDAPGGAGPNAETPTAPSSDDSGDGGQSGGFGAGPSNQEIIDRAEEVSNGAVGGDADPAGGPGGSIPGAPSAGAGWGGGGDATPTDGDGRGETGPEVVVGTPSWDEPTTDRADISAEQRNQVLSQFLSKYQDTPFTREDLAVRQQRDGSGVVVEPTRGAVEDAAADRLLRQIADPDITRADVNIVTNNEGEPVAKLEPAARAELRRNRLEDARDRLQTARENIDSRVDSLVNNDTEAGRATQSRLAQEAEAANIGSVRDRVDSLLGDRPMGTDPLVDESIVRSASRGGLLGENDFTPGALHRGSLVTQLTGISEQDLDNATRGFVTQDVQQWIEKDEGGVGDAGEGIGEQVLESTAKSMVGLFNAPQYLKAAEKVSDAVDIWTVGDVAGEPGNAAETAATVGVQRAAKTAQFIEKNPGKAGGALTAAVLSAGAAAASRGAGGVTAFSKLSRSDIVDEVDPRVNVLGDFRGSTSETLSRLLADERGKGSLIPPGRGDRSAGSEDLPDTIAGTDPDVEDASGQSFRPEFDREDDIGAADPIQRRRKRGRGRNDEAAPDSYDPGAASNRRVLGRDKEQIDEETQSNFFPDDADATTTVTAAATARSAAAEEPALAETITGGPEGVDGDFWAAFDDPAGSSFDEAFGSVFEGGDGNVNEDTATALDRDLSTGLDVGSSAENDTDTPSALDVGSVMDPGMDFPGQDSNRDPNRDPNRDRNDDGSRDRDFDFGFGDGGQDQDDGMFGGVSALSEDVWDTGVAQSLEEAFGSSDDESAADPFGDGDNDDPWDFGGLGF